MEQISGTVERSAAAALEADQRSGIATQMASRGGEVVADAVGTMNEIETASDRIGAIISVIDGIAFQTNILALNAAVEAARAGDRGRGFAVVAHEVRSLAQRSAQAAREVKQLVEETVSRVEAALVHQAGETMGKKMPTIQSGGERSRPPVCRHRRTAYHRDGMLCSARNLCSGIGGSATDRVCGTAVRPRLIDAHER
ncbi:hypothetical protein JG536_16850 [Burkholderia ambifaria]|nr:hypothetical protein JG536_16850 [Burkholderia ambifaria]